MGIEVNIDDELDRWRWCCPNGHRSWEPTNNHFWCHSCARRQGVDGEFHELHDLSNDETVGREELVLITDAGPYREVYGKEGAP
jgi:hypothetical protein